MRIALTPALLLALCATVAAADGLDESALLLDFERPVQARAWRAVRGPRPQRVRRHATQGRYSLRTETGALLRSRALPSDWSAYEALTFSVFHTGDAPAELHIVIGDRAWERNRTYWNRYNAVTTLQPGENLVRIPVHGLYRGESGSRNNDIPGPIDPTAITRIDLTFRGPATKLYLDDFRLVRIRPPRGVLAFDFGPEDQSVWPGFTPVTWNTRYAPESDFGLDRPLSSAGRAGDTAFPTPLLQDFLWLEDRAFVVDAEPGQYRLFWTFEDSGYWANEHAKHTRRALVANDREVWSETRPDGEAHAWFRFLDHEPEPGPGALDFYYDALYTPHAVDIDIEASPLRLRFDADAPWATRLSSLALVAADNEAAHQWIADAYSENRREFLTRHPSADRPVEAAPLPDDAPLQISIKGQPWQEGEPLHFRGARGETVSRVLTLRAGESTAIFTTRPLRSEAGQIPQDRILIRQARAMAKRVPRSMAYRVIPWYLDDADPVHLPAAQSRQVWVSVSIPDDLAPDDYSGRLVVEHRGKRYEVPLILEVLPIRLPDLPFPVALFQMEPSMFPLLRSYGFTAACGGPGTAVRGFDEDGAPLLDMQEVETWMAEARASGLRQQPFAYPGPGHFRGMSPYNTARVLERWANEAGLETVEAARRLFAARTRHADDADWLPLTWIAFDEPRSRAQAETLLTGLAILNEAAPDLKTLGYYNVNPRARTDPFLHQALYHQIDAVAMTHANPAILEAMREDGKAAYLYNFGRNRYAFGFGLWLARRDGVQGLVQWHAWIVHGYQFFDFDGREPDDGLLVRTRDGWRATLDLERIRLGIDDHRYLEKLQTLIQEARAADRHTDADKAERLLAEVLDPLPAGSRYPPAGFDQDAARDRIIDAILSLRP